MYFYMIRSFCMLQTICICGAGTMGSGITQVAALSGFTAIQFDVNEAVLEKSRAAIFTNLQYLVDKQKISAQQKEAALKRIVFTSQYSQCVAGLVIEAIVENPDAKLELFGQLAQINSSNSIFASNTSSLSITDLQKRIANPERVAGMHFFNPAHIMKLVELVKGKLTDDKTIEILREVCLLMGKTAVVCYDSPGFIVNRVARPYYLEALRLLESGAATVESIDRIMEATGFKMGPFRLMDLIGLDVNYSVSQIVWEALGQPERLRPSAIQKGKVNAGELGRKTGKGFL
jgi:3-hydroxybutyryl-CoA dehydrogenase